MISLRTVFKTIVTGFFITIPITITFIPANNNKTTNQNQQTNTFPFRESALVTKIIDGDKIMISNHGKMEKIRLCGINAPQLDQPLGLQSQANLQRLVDEGNGEVFIAPIKKDKFGFMVAEVSIHANQSNNSSIKDLSYLQVANGMATLDTHFSEGCLNLKRIARIQIEAKQQDKGIWNTNF